MMDRPILFSGLMVRALLAGRKTQTRRVLNPQPYDFPHPDDGHRCWNASGVVGGRIAISDAELARLHRYVVGDRLYVREAWRVSKNFDAVAPRDLTPRRSSVIFEAGGSIANQPSGRWEPSQWPEFGAERQTWIGKFRQGMHMPRWASRLTLTVTDVRVQRLQEIDQADARAEGVALGEVFHEDGRSAGFPEPRLAFRNLWDSLNDKRGFGWDANPWVVAISFSVEHRNIDAEAGQ